MTRLMAGAWQGADTGVAGLVLLCGLPLVLLLLFSAALCLHMRRRARRLSRSLRKSNAELRRANARLQKIAFRDPLTGAANRVLLEHRLAHAIARARDRAAAAPGGEPARVALLFIDLDGFKPVNDAEGHAAGDVLLGQLVGRLRHVARKADTLARVGGDEFVLLMASLASVADAVVMAQRLQRQICRPFDLSGKQVFISGSIGVAVYPDHGGADGLMAAADAAMYAAKRAGGKAHVVFKEHMRQGGTVQFDLQQGLRQALGNGELQLFYQPKVDARTGRICGVEALARWVHPRYGMISPRVFIPLAERYGLIGEIGEWVMEEACRQMAEWALQQRHMRVSINVSGYQIYHARVCSHVRGLIAKHGLQPQQLILEITESVAMEDDKTTLQVIAELAELGVQISIDDFGTGYSSLALLRQLCADEVKIDRSFVRDVATKADARAVVDAIVRLAHALDLRVVAEGVANQQQCEVLQDLGCDELQGFYFARPMDARSLTASALWTDDGAAPLRFSHSSFMDADVA
jgi:diguanylate cyclase (GGDEF)-like protein